MCGEGMGCVGLAGTVPAAGSEGGVHLLGGHQWGRRGWVGAAGDGSVGFWRNIDATGIVNRPCFG